MSLTRAVTPYDVTPDHEVAMWFDASDHDTFPVETEGLFSQWNDKSSYANHMVQASAASQATRVRRGHNGLDIVRMNPTGCFYNSSGTIGGKTYRMFLVAYNPGLSYHPDATNGYFMDGRPTANIIFAQFANGSNPSNIGLWDGTWEVPATAKCISTPQVYAGNLNDDYGPLATNGLVIDSSGNISTRIIGPTTFFSDYLNTSSFLIGDVYEMIIIDVTIADNRPVRQLYEGYLAWKWGITLDSAHPYYLERPEIAFTETFSLQHTRSIFWHEAQDYDNFRFESQVDRWYDLSYDENLRARNNFQYQLSDSLQPYYQEDTFNGLPCVSFNGADWLKRDSFSADPSDWTCIAMVKPSGTVELDSSTIFGSNSDTFAFSSLSFTGKQGFKVTGDDWQEADVAPTLDYQIQGFVLDSSAGVDGSKMYRDGVEIGSGTYSTQIGLTQTNLGSESSGSGDYEGLIAEAVLIPYAVTTEERQQIEGYLAHRWGLATLLDSAHPYRYNAPDPVWDTGNTSLVILASKVNSDLAYFPIRIFLDGEIYTYHEEIFKHIGDNFKRLSVIDKATGLECYTEVVSWDSTAGISGLGEAVLYAQVPLLSSTVNTELDIYWSSVVEDNYPNVGATGDVVVSRVYDEVPASPSADWLATEVLSEADELISYGLIIRDVIMSVLEQSYDMRALAKALTQPYGLYTTTKTVLEQRWSDIFTAILSQPYDSMPIIMAVLEQFYDSKGILIAELKQPFEDKAQLMTVLEQPYTLRALLLAVLVQKYKSIELVPAAVLKQTYDIKDSTTLQAILKQYYSLPASPSELPPVVVVPEINGEKAEVTSIDWDYSLDSYTAVFSMNLVNYEDWLKLEFLQPVVVTINGIEHHTVVSDFNANESVSSKTYPMEARSQAILLDFPYATAVPEDFDHSGTASEICERLANLSGLSITWHLDSDPPQSVNTVQLAGNSPLSGIRSLANPLGGKVNSYPDGSIHIVKRYAVNTDKYDEAVVDHELTTLEDFTAVNTDTIKGYGYNVYDVSSTSSTSGYEMDSEEITPSHFEIRASKVPWNSENVILETSELTNVVIIPRGATEEEVTETIEIKNGTGNVAEPYYGTVEYSYPTRTDLGEPTITEDGVVTTADGTTMIDITYITRYWKWDTHNTDQEQVQFILVKP